MRHCDNSAENNELILFLRIYFDPNVELSLTLFNPDYFYTLFNQ